MAEPIKIDLVPKDHSNDTIVKVFNPLNQDFVHKFDGKEKTIPAGKAKSFPENVGVLLASHLGMLITTSVAMKERKTLLDKISDYAGKMKLEQKPYPRFAIRAAEVAKLLVLPEDAEETPDTSAIAQAASEKGAEGKAGAKQASQNINPQNIELVDQSMTVAEMKKILAKKGVEFKNNAKKSELEALLAKTIKNEESDKE